MTAVASHVFTASSTTTRPADATRFLYQAPAADSSGPRQLSLTYTDTVRPETRYRLESVVTQVNHLLRLPHGWNGATAARISTLAALMAIEWLDRIAEPGVPTPHVVPLENGGVQFEWVADGDAFEIEASSNGTIAVLGVDSAGNTLVEGELTADRWPDSVAHSRKILSEMFRDAVADRIR